MVSLFRRSNQDDNTNHVAQLLMRRLDGLEYDRLVTFESTLMDHENRMLDMQHRVNLLEAHANRNVQRARMSEPDEDTSRSATQDAALPTDEARPPLPLPAPPLHTLNMLEAEVAQRGWGEVISLTEAANQYGSGAPSGAPAGQSTDLLTLTPPLTPRSPPETQSQPQREPDPSEPHVGEKLPRVPEESRRT